MSGERDWVADWVWSPGSPGDPDSYTLFRTELDCDKQPADAVLHLSADLRYRLWVNDEVIADGPPPSYPRAVYYDSHRIADRLRPGRNCIAVVVRCTGREPDRRAGLLCELESAGVVLLPTNEAGPWRCRPGDAWTSSPVAQAPMNHFDPYQEIFDARREPAGWRDAGFDDSQWATVQRAGHPDQGLAGGQWESVLARPIPAMEETGLRPVAVGVDECLWLETRTRPDLSIALSQTGRPLSAARVDGADRLISGDGPAILACSDPARTDPGRTDPGRTDPGRTDPGVDGVYDPCLLLDFGREETAFVELDVEAEAGAVIDIGLAERLVDGQFNNAIEGQFCSRYVLREGRQTWRSFAWRGFRYLRLRARHTTGLQIHAVRALRTRYPFTEVGQVGAGQFEAGLFEAGQFEAGDSRLNQIFEICRHTVRLCSHESIMDTPWREQAQWLGDISAVTAPAIRTVFGDTALVQKFIRQSAGTVLSSGTLANITNAAANPGNRPARDIPDYTLWWVIDLLEHYRYTGDQDLVSDLFPVVEMIMDGFARQLTPYGTLRSFGWVFIDWADLDTQGESAALAAIFHGALRAAAGLASVVAAEEQSRQWSRRAETLHDAFGDRFWSADHGAYLDAVHPDGVRSDRISEQTNFAAIRFGLVPEARAQRLATRILDDRTVIEAQPFFASVMLDALRMIGRTDLALSVIEDRWGQRMLDRGATSCFEEWGLNGSWRGGEYAGFMRTQSHAWSAHPATFLIKGLAGIDVLEPGCRRIAVDPYLGLDFRAVFPTPLGAVTVAVRDGVAQLDAPADVAIERRR